MATGDNFDMVRRLRAALPFSWFPAAASGAPGTEIGDPIGDFIIGESIIGAVEPTPTSAPILDGLLTGFAACFSWLFSLLSYVDLQGRLATATGSFLDMIGLDFLGTNLLRKPGQSDDSWRARIETEILAPKATRPAMVQRLTDLTGRAPVIFEPAFPPDTGGYTVGGVGYGVGGGYGCLLLPFQCFITAYRPAGGGIAMVAGYGNASTFLYGAGGYGVGAIEYATAAMIEGQVTDADINAAIAACAPVGTIPWTRISN